MVDTGVLTLEAWQQTPMVPGVPHSIITDGEIMSIHDRLMEDFRKLRCFAALRQSLAPLVESLVRMSPPTVIINHRPHRQRVQELTAAFSDAPI